MKASHYEPFADCIAILSDDIFRLEEPTLAFWRTVACQGNNVSLLSDNIFNKTVTSGENLYLVSAVETSDSFDEIRAGMGCLGNVVYCVQAYPLGGGMLELHNFGTVVMQHRDTKTFTPIVFELETNGLNIGRINYLRMGRLFNALIDRSEILAQPPHRNAFYEYWQALVETCGSFIEHCNTLYSEKRSIKTVEEAQTLLDGMADSIKHFKSLSYIYFEASSLALMIGSINSITTELLKKGEFNHTLYIDLVYKFQTNRNGDQFASYEFAPRADTLRDILTDMNADGSIDMNVDRTLVQIANNILFYLGTCFGDESALKGNAFFDFCNMPPYKDKLGPDFDNLISTLLSEYYRRNDYDIVINSAIEKGEIGICTHINRQKIHIASGLYNNKKTQVIEKAKLASVIRSIENIS